jgi:hypothetical protein
MFVPLSIKRNIMLTTDEVLDELNEIVADQHQPPDCRNAADHATKTIYDLLGADNNSIVDEDNPNVIVIAQCPTKAAVYLDGLRIFEAEGDLINSGVYQLCKILYLKGILGSASYREMTKDIEFPEAIPHDAELDYHEAALLLAANMI